MGARDSLFALIRCGVLVAMSGVVSSVAAAAPAGIELVAVRGGSFRMGCPGYDGFFGRCTYDEMPAHGVRLSPFLLGRTEVTVAQWTTVMGEDAPGAATCDTCPIHDVPRREVLRFLDRLSELDGLTPCYTESPMAARGCEGYRLPTEAEWEFAARAGRTPLLLTDKAAEKRGWVRSNSGGDVHPVGRKPANAWGLHDMVGNVSEYVDDQQYDYAAGRMTPSAQMREGSRLLGVLGASDMQMSSWSVRGGSFESFRREARLTWRAAYYTIDGEDAGEVGVGFRVARAR